MNWVQFCIIMAYVSWFICSLNGWAQWFENVQMLAALGWIVAALVIAFV